MKFFCTFFFSIFCVYGIAQVVPDTVIVAKQTIAEPIPIEKKKPLTHDVYDKWENMGERAISNNGKIIIYAVNPQEGDGNLYVNTPQGNLMKKIPRGYGAIITNDNKFVIGKIKPLFADTREARIKKKKPDEMPKDSLFVYNIETDSLQKIAKVKSFKTPEKEAGWVAYLLEKIPEAPNKPKTIVAPDSLTQINTVLHLADSLRKMADSLVLKTKEAKNKGLQVLQPPKKENKPSIAKSTPDIVEEGTDLVLRNLATGKEQVFKLTSEYYFDKYAKRLLIETSKKNGDSIRKALVLWQDLVAAKTDTIFAGFNDAKNYAISEDAEQVAFVVEKDSVAKALQKFYKLYYYNNQVKLAKELLNKEANAVKKQKLTISPDYNNLFSKDGKKLFFGLAPIRKPKDTTLVDFETARLDIWNYKDDYLQPLQLLQVNQDLKKSYTAVFNINKDDFGMVSLATDTSENIALVDEGNADFVLASSSKGNRVATQWQGFVLQNYYLIATKDGSVKNIVKNNRSGVAVSPKGKFAIWYDYTKRNWTTYNTTTGAKATITATIKVPLYDEEDDHPDEPNPYGVMRWEEEDAAVYIYDRYDIWKCDPTGVVAPVQITFGRAAKVITRWVNTDADDRFLIKDKEYLFSYFSEETKRVDIMVNNMDNIKTIKQTGLSSTLRGFVRAKENWNNFIYTAENPQNAPYLVCYQSTPMGDNPYSVTILHQPNPQQEQYVWYDAELLSWKMLDGKRSEGILYKPENFDPKKKYPIIFYFYERNSDDLYTYKSPAPSASTVNIPYFVSNGYLVFDPNIYYKNGEPGESAYNAIVSAAKFLTQKYKWVDSTKMAIQGQSWGGYQVAYLVTRTNMFAAAGAGAPVSNMTSAYGGIRWGTGLSRQFQYEKSQSRIGGTLWNKKDLYIKNSPLFFADKVKTPLLLMHNDKDGAVPWYQSIEYFSALKRLDKKVWLLQYNDEDHNLIERRNRKDLSIRLAQFFDHYLKGKPMPKWMNEGVPATEKGVEWGL
jgi:dipeptidyl aminopeptidase/acylaminoacyl peptidase